MPDLAIAAVGVTVFALTTWASLAFGYQVFQHLYEADEADETAPAQPAPDERVIPLLTVDTTEAGAAPPSEIVLPASPAA